jgi:hypothetical protein
MKFDLVAKKEETGSDPVSSAINIKSKLKLYEEKINYLIGNKFNHFMQSVAFFQKILFIFMLRNLISV